MPDIDLFNSQVIRSEKEHDFEKESSFKETI